MTNGRRRRVMLALLALCLSVIVGIGLQLWASLRSDRVIDYGARTLTPIPAEVCPGETFTFPVSIDINQGDSVSRITEGWCRVSDGICPRTLQLEPYYVNFVEPYSVRVTATRTVPVDLPPGDWQLRHCNETHASDIIDVTCWMVPITVKECGP